MVGWDKWFDMATQQIRKYRNMQLFYDYAVSLLVTGAKVKNLVQEVMISTQVDQKIERSVGAHWEVITSRDTSIHRWFKLDIDGALKTNTGKMSSGGLSEIIMANGPWGLLITLVVAHHGC